MMHINAKAIPTNDTDYRCYIKAVELVNQSYGVYIAALVFNSLEGGDIHTHTHTHIHTYTHTYTHTRKHTIDTIDYITEI